MTLVVLNRARRPVRFFVRPPTVPLMVSAFRELLLPVTLVPVADRSSNGTSLGGGSPLLYSSITVCESYMHTYTHAHTRFVFNWHPPQLLYTVSQNKKAQLTRGLRATAVRVYRHLGFLKFESCTISLAVPENHTLQANSTSIGKLVAKLWQFLYIQDGRQPPSWILSNRK